MFGKLLIANRGEIAVRIIPACRELGIETVAVYSEADENSTHRRMADEAYLIGPAPAADSYLNIERIVGAVKESGAEAVHPGYGFLSENSAFARAVEEAGAVWVGPPPEAMDLMGEKVRAKEAARRAEVPTVPGYDGEDQCEDQLAEEAGEIGYPVLVKASAGGGGRGMRIVHAPENFAEAVRGAKREAEAAFGSGSVFLEKLVENPRHVEVQIIADAHGSVLHLYERECSIQRRHQKVVEEAPSPALSQELRERICAAAVRLAREADYQNAGTVEFLLDGEEFYFLEMNARLQVEHPVTELVTGLDLVSLQLAVASGEELPLSQEDVGLRGAAIEVRVYAEDKDGLPAGGRLLGFELPEGPGVRNDAGVETGDEVSLHYDPMISKLIVHAQNRKLAVARLRNALANYTALGLPTNIPLLRRIASHPAFAAGENTTSFLEEHGLMEARTPSTAPAEAFLLAAACEILQPCTTSDAFAYGPWRLLGAASIGYRSGGEEHTVETERAGGGKLRLRHDGREAIVQVLSLQNGRLHATLDGKAVAVGFAVDNSGVEVSIGGKNHRLEKPLPPEVDAEQSGAGAGASLVAPMPGTVVSVLVEKGEKVEQGQPLLVLEAMKMEQTVAAPDAGTVRSLPYSEGDLVPCGAILAEIE